MDRRAFLAGLAALGVAGTGCFDHHGGGGGWRPRGRGAWGRGWPGGGRFVRGGRGFGFRGGPRAFGARRFRSLEDDQNDPTKVTAPPGCPKNVVAYEVPNRPAKLFVHCEWDHPDDVSLLVIEPGDDKCCYSAPLSKSGGSIDTDTAGATSREAYTSGEKPPAGTYKILACHVSGKGKIKASVVVETNAKMDGWAAQRFVVELPEPNPEMYYPVTTIDLK